MGFIRSAGGGRVTEGVGNVGTGGTDDQESELARWRMRDGTGFH